EAETFRQERADEEAKHLESYKKLVDKKAGWRVDPTRGISGNRQTWGWIAAAISGLGSALKGEGGKNPALDMLMANLDRNVQFQMAGRDNLAEDVQNKRAEIADFRAATKSRLGEYSLESAAAYERAARMAEAYAAKAGGVAER